MEYTRTTSQGNLYIAIDLKSFYASVECIDRGLNPLTTNLVVADPSRTEKTICLAVSPSLKAYGIPGRARLFEVQQKLKEVKQRTGKEVEYIIAPPRMARYIEVSAEIYATYLKYISPEDIHVYSIDECFMDVTNYLKLYQMSAKELVVKMIHDVLERTGITATAGIGTNLYLSKIAMDIVAKHVEPDASGVRIAELDELTYRRLLWNHKPITDFWRIGGGIAKRLEKNGLYTMGDIARISIHNEDLLYKMIGIDAELLIDHAWGYEPCTMKEIKSYKPSTNSISSGQVLQHPYDFSQTRIVVQEMTDLLVLDLVEKGLVTDSLTLTIGYDRSNVDEGAYEGEIIYDRYGRAIPKSAHGTANLGTTSSSTKKIMTAMLELYDRIVSKELMVRRVTVSANNLVEEKYEQYDLFMDPVEQAKERKMQEAMLAIKKKFGKNAILKGINFEEGATTIERNNQIGGHKA
ncbi:DNA methylase [Lachnospiraceae bacterium MD1]|uniref:DNA methylase n=1 Tax=Variimorphobacter saccharofermentans TaxID=2755051 RepID=A0A839K5K8_9FIRM|nr:DNA methylase [Variimorphobacter saccharofermentans]MBB2183951.1 DNA methylase [Variimorphobacter saccharofermentans]